jgi:hypothetical protein
VVDLAIIILKLTERKSQLGNFPLTDDLRILSFLTAQSSPANASVGFGSPPSVAYGTM